MDLRQLLHRLSSWICVNLREGSAHDRAVANGGDERSLLARDWSGHEQRHARGGTQSRRAVLAMGVQGGEEAAVVGRDEVSHSGHGRKWNPRRRLHRVERVAQAIQQLIRRWNAHIGKGDA